MRIVWLFVFERERPDPESEDGLSKAARVGKWAAYVLVAVAVLAVIVWRVLSR